MADRAAFWQKLVARRRRERLSVAQLCHEAGVSPASFYAWQRRLRSVEQPELVPVHIVPVQGTSGSSDAAIEIELPEAIRLRIAPGCDRQTLAMVLSVVRGEAR
jgi:transposase-like protein